eukprot:scaffold10870_cov117-Isochrysis_galbana.AAC.7
MYAATTELSILRAIPGTRPKRRVPAATRGPASGNGITEHTTTLISEYSTAIIKGPPDRFARSTPNTCRPAVLFVAFIWLQQRATDDAPRALKGAARPVSATDGRGWHGKARGMYRGGPGAGREASRTSRREEGWMADEGECGGE